jgi:putative addiction module killer protein
MIEVAIRSFVAADGRVPFQAWLDSLDRQTQARIAVALTRLSRGNRSHVKGLGGGVAELKLDFGPGYRIYFGQDGDACHLARRRHQEAAKRRHRGRQGTVGGIQGSQDVASSMRPHMALTRSFKDHIKAKIQSDPEFRQALFQEAVQTLIEGDVGTARAVLRDFINATVGFAALAKATGIPPKSLMRMFGPSGNPTAANLSEVIRVLQKKTGVHLEVRASAA